MKDMKDIEERLAEIDTKLDVLIQLLKPVHAHASWVDSLKRKLSSLRILPYSAGRDDVELDQWTIEDQKEIQC
jgi:hypothetical protein